MSVKDLPSIPVEEVPCPLPLVELFASGVVERVHREAAAAACGDAGAGGDAGANSSGWTAACVDVDLSRGGLERGRPDGRLVGVFASRQKPAFVDFSQPEIGLQVEVMSDEASFKLEDCRGAALGRGKVLRTAMGTDKKERLVSKIVDAAPLGEAQEGLFAFMVENGADRVTALRVEPESKEVPLKVASGAEGHNFTVLSPQIGTAVAVMNTGTLRSGPRPGTKPVERVHYTQDVVTSLDPASGDLVVIIANGPQDNVLIVNPATMETTGLSFDSSWPWAVGVNGDGTRICASGESGFQEWRWDAEDDTWNSVYTNDALKGSQDLQLAYFGENVFFTCHEGVGVLVPDPDDPIHKKKCCLLDTLSAAGLLIDEDRGVLILYRTRTFLIAGGGGARKIKAARG